MPTINKRFLLKLCLVLIACASVLFGANALQTRRIPEALWSQTQRAVELDDLNSAVRYLKQYLEFRPDDMEAQVRLAEVLEKRDGNSRKPSELFYLQEKILREDPSRENIRRSALKLCLKMRRYSDALSHAEALLKSHPKDGELWYQLAMAQSGLNQLAEARKSYEQALECTSDQPLAFQRLAQFVWKHQRDIPGTREILNRFVAALPLDPEAFLSRARFEAFLAAEGDINNHSKADLDRALRDLQRVLELDPENADALQLTAEILQRGRSVPAAHALLRDGVGLYPKDLRLTRSLAWMELVRGNAPAAIAVLEEGLKHQPDGFDLLIPLADLLVQQGDTVRTEAIVQRLAKRKAPPLQMQYLNARLAMKQEKWPAALELLESLRKQAVNMPGLEIQVNQLLAMCHQKLADPASQEKALKRVLDVDPLNVAVRTTLGVLMMNQGRMDEALREYEVACQSPYASGSVFAQAIRLKIRQMRATGATAQEWARLEEFAGKSASRFSPVDCDPVLLRAEILHAQGRGREASQFLRTETIRRPGDARLWASLAYLEADVHGTSEGLAVIDEAQAVCGDGPEIRLARASLYARDPARIRQIDILRDRLDSWPDLEIERLLAGLADIHDRINDQKAVIECLAQLAKRRVTDRPLWIRLHNRALSTGDTQAAAEARDALVKLDGEGSPAVTVCDARQASDGDATIHIGRLESVIASRPEYAEAWLTLAELHEKVGNQTSALQSAWKAWTLEPTRFETNRAVLILLSKLQDKAELQNHLRRLAGDSRWSGEPYRRLMGMVAEHLPAKEGIALLEQTPAFLREEPATILWMAEQYRKAGMLEKAGAVLSAAVEGPKFNADLLLGLALHHAMTGEGEKLSRLFDTARSRLSPAGYFGVAASFAETPHHSLWQPKLNTPDDYRQYVQARMTVKLSQARPQQAAEILENFLEKKDLRPTDQTWAKRNLAMLYVLGQSSPEGRRKALSLISETDIGAMSRLDEFRGTAAVLTTLSRYLEGADRAKVLAQAIACLEKAVALNQSPKDIFNLAQLQRIAGRAAESRASLNRLLQLDPDNLYYLITALEILVAAEDYTSASNFAERLRLRHGGEFRAVAAVARYEALAGRAERSFVLADEYVRAAGPDAGDYLTRSARVAELLDELARFPKVRGTEVGRRMVEAAVERYEALVPSRPEAAVAIAGLLAYDRRVPEAFNRLEQLHRYLPARTRLHAGLAILRSGNANEWHFSQVRSWLDACRADEGSSLSLQLAEAEFFSLQPDLPKAISAYRAVLSQDPRHVTALNNLAWLLAVQPESVLEAEALVAQAIQEYGITAELLDTRARIRITAGKYDQAQADIQESLRQGRTPLRLFHLALLRMSQAPPREQEAQELFEEALDRGLDTRAIHPFDLPIFRRLESTRTAKHN